MEVSSHRDRKSRLETVQCTLSSCRFISKDQTSKTSIITQAFLFHVKTQHQVVAAVLPRGLPCSASGKLSHSGLRIDVEVNEVDKCLLADFCGSVGLGWVLMLCVCFIALL